jgi:hypothetical protein
MKSLLIKGLTLAGFLSLIAIFLLYRTGKLDNYLPGNNSDLQTSPNGGAINAGDSTPQRDSVERLRMFSSKVAILPKPAPIIVRTPRKTQSEMMSSSKSIVVIRDKPRQQQSDSLYFDSILKSKKKP